VSWLEQFRPDGKPASPVPPADPFDAVRAGGQGYARAALDGETDKVMNAANGTRNHTLNAAAFSLSQLIAGGELEEPLVVAELTAAARLVGLGDREIGRTIRSGLDAGAKQPRTRPVQVETAAVFAGQRAAETAETGETVTLLDRLRAALVDSRGLDHIPEPVPLVDGVLYRDSTAWLIGPPGNGKSFVALDVAGCVGTGEAWQGHKVSRGGVLYLVAEGLSGVRQRVRAWESSVGFGMVGVQFLPVAVQAANDAEWRSFVELAGEIKPALIVIDTQARVTVGMEENAAKDMGVFVQRIEALRIASGGCVLVVHHQGRSGDHMRGSTALEGAATTIIKVAKDEDLISVECTKQKDAPPFDPFKLRLIQYDSSAILSLNFDETPHRTDTPATRRALSDWWNSHETDWVSVSSLVESKVVTKPTFHRVKKPLERAGLIEATGEGSQRRYRLTRQPQAP
jgi:hypothetical protein